MVNQPLNFSTCKGPTKFDGNSHMQHVNVSTFLFFFFFFLLYVAGSLCAGESCPKVKNQTLAPEKSQDSSHTKNAMPGEKSRC